MSTVVIIAFLWSCSTQLQELGLNGKWWLLIFVQILKTFKRQRMINFHWLVLSGFVDLFYIKLIHYLYTDFLTTIWLCAAGVCKDWKSLLC